MRKLGIRSEDCSSNDEFECGFVEMVQWTVFVLVKRNFSTFLLFFTTGKFVIAVILALVSEFFWVPLAKIFITVLAFFSIFFSNKGFLLAFICAFYLPCYLYNFLHFSTFFTFTTLLQLSSLSIYARHDLNMDIRFAIFFLQ